MPLVTLANGRNFPAEAGSSILDAALSSGLTLEHSCRTGRCGACKARVLKGSSMPLREESSLAPEETTDGWILTCARQADTDLELDIEDLSALAGIAIKTLPSKINRLRLVAPDILMVELRLPPNADFGFLAGQYIDVIGPGGTKRSYSLASDPAEPNRLELHIKRVDGGVMSAYWFEQASVGDLLRFRGPLGTFFLRDVAGKDLIFLATGTGYAPVQSMLASLDAVVSANRPRSVRVLWGGRSAQEIYSTPQLGAHELVFLPVLSRSDETWRGSKGHVQDVLLSQQQSLDNAVVYACGSDAMIHSARATLTEAGLARGCFFSDAFVSSD